MISANVIIQEKRRTALSVSAAPSQLSQRESQGASPWRGWMAADCRRYSGDTMIWVVPFTPTGYTSNVAGGRLPPLQYICFVLPYI